MINKKHSSYVFPTVGHLSIIAWMSSFMSLCTRSITNMLRQSWYKVLHGPRTVFTRSSAKIACSILALVIDIIVSQRKTRKIFVAGCCTHFFLKTIKLCFF